MSIRYILKNEVKEHEGFEKPDGGKCGKLVLDGSELRLWSDGLVIQRYCIEVSATPADPRCIDLGEILGDLLWSVTCKEQYADDFVNNGLYELGSAKAEVATRSNTDSNAPKTQTIIITADSFADLKALYLGVRSGEISPKVRWGLTATKEPEDSVGAGDDS